MELNIRKSLLIFAFLLPTFASNASWQEPSYDFEEVLSACGSLSSYNDILPVCNRLGFSYPKIDVRYDTDYGDQVDFIVKQATFNGTVVDHYIDSSIQVKCSNCDNQGNVEEVMNRAIAGLTKAARTGSLKTKNTSDNNEGNFFLTVAKEIFTDVRKTFTNNFGSSIVENKTDYSKIQRNPVIIVTDKDGNPEGSGYVEDGQLKKVVELTKQSDGSLQWSGTVDFTTGVKLVEFWIDFTYGGDNRSCKVVYTGTSIQMAASIVCY